MKLRENHTKDLALQARLYGWLSCEGHRMSVGWRPEEEGVGFTISLDDDVKGETARASGDTLLAALEAVLVELED